MVKGFQLIALSSRGEDVIRKFNIKDSKLQYIKIVSENPFTLEFVFRYRYRAFVLADSINLFIQKTFNENGVSWGVDYEVKIL